MVNYRLICYSAIIRMLLGLVITVTGCTKGIKDRVNFLRGIVKIYKGTDVSLL